MADGAGRQTRPALADVLAVVTTEGDAVWWRMMLDNHRTRLTPEGVEWEMGGGVPWARLRGWTHATIADALAALVEAGLLPEQWLRPEYAPRWWCESCAERGEKHTTAVPPSHPALVAVASLGATQLATAEAIVAERWRARVVWRVMTAGEIAQHHDEVHRNALPASLRGERLIADAFVRSSESERCPCDSPVVHRAWPALRALAALGLHLLAVDDGRVTLGVEALP